MGRWRRFMVAGVVAWLSVAAALAQERPGAAAAPEPLPGSPAPSHVVAEIRQTVDAAIARFEAMDAAGVLAHVSDRYRTGPLTKAVVAEQLRTVFAIHDQVRARVRIDDIRMVGDHAWVYSTGEVTGRLRYLGTTMPVVSWERELEVGRRENGRWRLFGYQQ
ncbi:MAG: hypothetical protein ACREKH_11915 [Candidatus Rokuibacteriota bacterium]